MEALPTAPPARLVGRDTELDRLLEVVDAAATGSASMVLVSGVAGVGKTALVSETIGRRRQGVTALAGACLPLSSVTVPFLPLRQALRAVGGEPSLFSDGSPDAVVVRIDGRIDALARERPVVLAVDDLHWADPGTLDLLTYLLAGPADRRLAVLLGLRSSDLVDGHPLHRWLADATRMPGFTELPLSALDVMGTSEQIGSILGVPPRDSLVQDVFARSRGNPYFTRLLVQGLPADAPRLTHGMPARLTEAVLRSWHGLPDAARGLTQLLAVGGRPMSVADLSAVAGDLAQEEDVARLLDESASSGVLVVDDEGRYWFGHPLQAQVLERGTPPERRRQWHTAHARHLERMLSPPPGRVPVEGELETAGRGPDRAVLLAAIADHHVGAGAAAEAYTWSLRAAEAAAGGASAAGALRLLRRAIDLHGSQGSPTASRLDLLLRARDLAEQLGRQADELRFVHEILDEPDADARPLLEAEMWVRRADLRLSLGEQLADLEGLRRAVDLSSAAPESPVHARALAQLAHAELWQEMPQGHERAREALRLARGAGEPRALSYALAAVVMSSCVGDEDPLPAVPLGTEAMAAALEAGDGWAFVHAALWTGNCQEVFTSPLYTDHLGEARTVLEGAGGASAYVGQLSANEATGLVWIGRWQEGVERLRVALGTSPGPMGETSARLAAAALAALQGRAAEARGHLHRADELFGEHTEFRPFEFDAVRSMVALATGDPAAALDAAITGLRSAGVPPTLCDRLLPLAARAAADLVADRRARGEPTTDIEERIDGLRRDFPEIVLDGALTPFYRAQVAGLQHVYDAELLRIHGDPGQAEAWAAAATACADGWCPWEGAYSAWRAAEAFLARRDGHREGVRWLREAFDRATALDARPVLTELGELARQSHVPLDIPEAARADVAELPGLTARERDVVALVVAGRTYAEIARQLFISEKTVSTHISNLLRKTGTSSRLELARWALRTQV